MLRAVEEDRPHLYRHTTEQVCITEERLKKETAKELELLRQTSGPTCWPASMMDGMGMELAPPGNTDTRQTTLEWLLTHGPMSESALIIVDSLYASLISPATRRSRRAQVRR